MPPIPSNVDAILMLLARGTPRAQISQALYNMDLGPKESAETLAEAKRQLVTAAAVARDEALGAAITRATEIYQRMTKVAKKNRDPLDKMRASRVALQASHELAKLLGLYQSNQDIQSAADAAAEAKESVELAAIAAHLRPLKLVPESVPLSEAARVAAERLLDVSPLPAAMAEASGDPPKKSLKAKPANPKSK